MKDYVAEFDARAEAEKKLREKLAEFASPQWRTLLEEEFAKLENELRAIETRQQALRESIETKQKDAWMDEKLANADEDRKAKFVEKKKAVDEHRSMREKEEKLAAIDKSHLKIGVFAEMWKNRIDTPNLPGDKRWQSPPGKGGPPPKNDDDRSI